MKALLKNYHQSPQKVRLVANAMRGKTVAQARAILAFLNKKSSSAMAKLLNSAFANASGASPDQLVIRKITVDKGLVMRRGRPFARGRSGSIRKTMSIVKIELGTKVAESRKSKTAKKI